MSYRENIKFSSVLVFTLVLAAILLVLQLDIGHAQLIADEGYIWYGAWRTSLGEVPIRDFESYDPAFYLWCALWFVLSGDSGLITYRAANAAFQFVGLTLGILILRRVTESYVILLLAGLVLLIWIAIPLKTVLDLTVAIAAVYGAVLLVEKPTARRHFGSGVLIGFIAFTGRNHGVYCAIAYLSLIAFIWIKVSRSDLVRKLAAWSCGVAVGYAPALVMMAFIPGFFPAFVAEILSVFQQGTNLPLPVPWPWQVTYQDFVQGPIGAAHKVVVGSIFVLMPLFFTVSLVYLFAERGADIKRHPVFLAAVFIGTPYMHYAFSRADVWHLWLAIFPFLLGVMSIPFPDFKTARLARSALVLALLGASVLTAGFVSPYSQMYLSGVDFAKVRVRNDVILLHPSLAHIIDVVSTISAEFVGRDETLLVAPHWPGLYPILGRKSPLREIYFLFPSSAEQQRNAVQKLEDENTNWVILGDEAVDGRQELRFRSTHPLLWEHFQVDFEEVPMDGLPENYRLLRRKTASRSVISACLGAADDCHG